VEALKKLKRRLVDAVNKSEDVKLLTRLAALFRVKIPRDLESVKVEKKEEVD